MRTKKSISVEAEKKKEKIEQSTKIFCNIVKIVVQKSE